MTSDADLIERLYEGFNARDIDAVLSKLAGDVAWANGMDGGHVHGRRAVRDYWTSQWTTIDPHVEPVKIERAEDGATVVDVRQVVRDRQGRLLLDETVRHRFHVIDGFVSRFDIEGPSQLSSIVHETRPGHVPTTGTMHRARSKGSFEDRAGSPRTNRCGRRMQERSESRGNEPAREGRNLANPHEDDARS
jgi:hypothetical protein